MHLPKTSAKCHSRGRGLPEEAPCFSSNKMQSIQENFRLLNTTFRRPHPTPLLDIAPQIISAATPLPPPRPGTTPALAQPSPASFPKRIQGTYPDFGKLSTTPMGYPHLNVSILRDSAVQVQAYALTLTSACQRSMSPHPRSADSRESAQTLRLRRDSSKACRCQRPPHARATSHHHSVRANSTALRVESKTTTQD